jgi:hypothetical protein
MNGKMLVIVTSYDARKVKPVRSEDRVNSNRLQKWWYAEHERACTPPICLK